MCNYFRKEVYYSIDHVECNLIFTSEEESIKCARDNLNINNTINIADVINHTAENTMIQHTYIIDSSTLLYYNTLLSKVF